MEKCYLKNDLTLEVKTRDEWIKKNESFRFLSVVIKKDGQWIRP